MTVAKQKYEVASQHGVAPFTKAGNVQVLELDGRFVVVVDGVAKYRTKTRQGADNIATKLYVKWLRQETTGWPAFRAVARNPKRVVKQGRNVPMSKISREIAKLDRVATGLSRRKKQRSTEKRQHRKNPGDVDRVLAGYLEAAVWASTDMDDGTPLDSRYSVRDFTQAAKATARKDVKEFLKRAGPLVDESGRSDGQIGHDFWLTRNGHGTGFWDRDLGDVGDKLTDIAHAFGEAYVYPSRGKLRF